MAHRASSNSRICTDPIVGAILSGWRYDISSISPEMRTEYESHLGSCMHCRERQRHARFIDFLFLSITMLSFVTFMLAVLVIHKLELLSKLPGTLPLHLRQMPLAISLESFAIAGLVLSFALIVLVAIATPLPGIITGLVRERVPVDLRERFARRHAA